MIKNDKNLGFAAANNIGIKNAITNGANYVLLLNNDIVVESSMIESFINASDKYPKIGIYGAKIYYYSDPNRLRFVRTKWNNVKYILL